MKIRNKYDQMYVFISKDAMFLYNLRYCMSNIHNNSIMIDVGGCKFYKIVQLVKSYRLNK